MVNGRIQAVRPCFVYSILLIAFLSSCGAEFVGKESDQLDQSSNDAQIATKGDLLLSALSDTSTFATVIRPELVNLTGTAAFNLAFQPNLSPVATIRAGADIIADNNNPTGQVSFLKTITFAVGRASSKLRGCADLQGGTRCNRAENYTPLSTLDYQFREPLKRWVSDAPPGSFPPNRYILRWWDPVTGAVSKEYKVEVTSDFSTVQMAILELRASDYTRELAPFQQYSIAAFNITEESQLCVAKRNGAGTGAKVCRSFKSLGFRHVPANSVFGQVYRANIPNFKIPRGVTDLLNQGRGLYDVSIINGTEASGSPHHIGVVTRL